MFKYDGEPSPVVAAPRGAVPWRFIAWVLWLAVGTGVLALLALVSPGAAIGVGCAGVIFLVAAFD